MKTYILIRKTELTSSMLNHSSENIKPVDVFYDDEESTGYVIVSCFDEFADVFKDYLKFDKSELEANIARLKANQQIKNKVPSKVRVSALPEPDGVKADFQGLGAIINSTDTEIVWKCLEDCYITEIDYFADLMVDGDKLFFEVWHPIAGKLDGFGRDWYVWDGEKNVKAYKTKLLAGLQVKIILEKMDANPRTLLVNGFIHKII
jgi:hypothetical protein